MAHYDITIMHGVTTIGNETRINQAVQQSEDAQIQGDVAGVSSRLKQMYMKHFKKWTVPVINQETFGCVEKDRNNFMLNLQIVKGGADIKIDQSFNEMHRYMKRIHGEANSIDTEQLVQQGSKRIFVQGVAGVGKTSFLEHVAFSWAKEEIFKDYELLFFLKCRNLIRYKDFNSKDLFEELFGVCLSNIKHLDGEKVLIVLDGLDELPSLENIFAEEPSCLLHSFIRDLLKKESPLFPGHTCIFTGRPHVQSVLLKHELHTIGKFLIFEVTGFSEETIAAYVENFANGDNKVANRIKDTIQASVNLKAIAAIPQFLSSLCGVLASENTGRNIHQTTELYVWVFISFIRQHFRELGEMPFRIVQDKRFRNFAAAVSKISYELLATGRRVFKQEELLSVRPAIDSLEKKLLDAFLIKIDTTTECLYQFKHVSLQEFLASVHCFEAGISISELLNSQMYVIAAFVAGLSSAGERAGRDKDDIVCLFVLSILQDQFLGDFVVIKERPSPVTITTEIFKRVQNRQITWRPFLAIFYELFREGDTVPSCVHLLNEIDFSFDHISSIELVHFVHCMKLILKTFGEKELSRVTFKLMNTNLSLKKSGDLAQIVKHLYSTKFLACEIDIELVDAISKAIMLEQGSVDSPILVFSNCNLLENHLTTLSACIPFLARFELWYNDISGSCASLIAAALVQQQENTRFRLQELRFHGCDFTSNVTAALCDIVGAVDKLDLTRCRLGSIAFDAIVDRIVKSRPCRLKGIALERCQDMDDGLIRKLCEAIPYLEQVNISRSATEPNFYEFEDETIETLANSIDTAYKKGELVLKRLIMNFFSHSKTIQCRFKNFKEMGIEVTFAIW